MEGLFIIMVSSVFIIVIIWAMEWCGILLQVSGPIWRTFVQLRSPGDTGCCVAPRTVVMWVRPGKQRYKMSGIHMSQLRQAGQMCSRKAYAKCVTSKYAQTTFFFILLLVFILLTECFRLSESLVHAMERKSRKWRVRFSRVAGWGFFMKKMC